MIDGPGVEQPEQRLAAAHLLVEDVRRNTLAGVPVPSGAVRLALTGGVEVVGAGGVEEADEGHGGGLLGGEDVAGGRFVGVPKAEGVLPLLVVGGVEVVDGTGVVGTVEGYCAARARAGVLLEEKSLSVRTTGGTVKKAYLGSLSLSGESSGLGGEEDRGDDGERELHCRMQR